MLTVAQNAKSQHHVVLSIDPQQNIYLLLIPLIQPFLLTLLAVESSREEGCELRPGTHY